MTTIRPLYKSTETRTTLDPTTIRPASQASLAQTVSVISEDHLTLKFELAGVDASYANALRRIMIAEVETMAIELVNIEANDSVVEDAILAHRLGLIPLKLDPEQYEPWRRGDQPKPGINAVEFFLNFTATLEAVQQDKSVHVMSGHLRTTRRGEGYESDASAPMEEEPGNPMLVADDIVLAKLLPKQRIKFTAYATRGNGKEHAKWSPVSTASYRLKPRVKINGSIQGDAAQRLKNLCPKNVFDIEDSTGAAFVSNAVDCSMCRECLRVSQDWPGQVELGREGDVFLFTIESTGQLRPRDILLRALAIFEAKCQSAKAEVQKLLVPE